MSYPYRPAFFQKYPEYIPPTSEEDAQTDPREKLKPACEEKCKKFSQLYEECAERVTRRNQLIKSGESKLDLGHCLVPHYELVACVDGCVGFRARADRQGHFPLPQVALIS